MKSVPVILSFFFANILLAGETNAPPRSSGVSILGWSPAHSFYVEQHTLTPNEVMKVWIVSSKNAKERQLVYTHGRSIEVLFSNDGHWLAINDHAGSNIANVVLFRQQQGVDFRRVEDVSVKAWAFLASKMGLKLKPGLDHQYVDAIRWTDDHTILLCIYGHTDHRNFVEDWLCLYDVESRTFSTDLDKHNKRHATMEVK
ncbi:MAG: hypothetical protein HZC54_06660 [Verrucomicrobia bacterium]|nr:hypothetical protein [Verrucomicrobiota bacterium]